MSLSIKILYVMYTVCPQGGFLQFSITWGDKVSFWSQSLNKLTSVKSFFIYNSFCSYSLLTHHFYTFPSTWKTALVLRLPKCGFLTWLSDFRPINILFVLSKEFKRLICAQFVDYLDFGSLCSSNQSGFRKFRSTATALTKIIDDIHLGVERSRFSISVLVDFSKAFDTISHDILLHRLRLKFGLSSTACRMFGSFLSGADWPLWQCGNCREDLFCECEALIRNQRLFQRLRGVLKSFSVELRLF
jgi:hypothetical protein